MKRTVRRVAVLLALGLALSVSACSSAESVPKADAEQSSIAPSASAPASSAPSESTPTPVATSQPVVPIHDQAYDESKHFYQDNTNWNDDKNGLLKSDPNDPDVALIGRNLNNFFPHVTREWKMYPGEHVPSETKYRLALFPISSVFLSNNIPEYQATKLFSAITETEKIWHDVDFMGSYDRVVFSVDGKRARVPVESISADASSAGLMGALNHKHADSGSGYFIFSKEDGDWKISGIGGYYGYDTCIFKCK